jgi:hypothetical protein
MGFAHDDDEEVGLNERILDSPVLALGLKATARIAKISV